MEYTLEERLVLADNINIHIRMAIYQYDYYDVDNEEKNNIKHLALDKINIPRTNE